MANTIKLTEIGRYTTGIFNQGAAEISAYDPTSKRLFVVNAQAATINLSVDGATDTISYNSGNGSDTVNQFLTGIGGDILSFSGIAAIDVVQSGSNTLFLVGDGIAGNGNFGKGALLITLANSSFTSADISTNIDPTNIPVFQFS
ncbi:hypothetical protein [Microseira wollei]|nr:hypothetical protein [Microseira wollei]